jgi:hypothetical protein
MQEYEEMAHMNQINEDASNAEEWYYLPHHAVFKSSSSTTRTRIVFDGSRRSSNGFSLNDILLVDLQYNKICIPLVYDLEHTKLHSPQI